MRIYNLPPTSEPVGVVNEYIGPGAVRRESCPRCGGRGEFSAYQRVARGLLVRTPAVCPACEGVREIYILDEWKHFADPANWSLGRLPEDTDRLAFRLEEI